MARIAVGGFQHETNTFSPQPANLENFLQGSGWPGLQSGEEMLATVAPMNLPITGAIHALRKLGHEVVPLVWAAATPSGRVEDRAFDEICARLVAALDIVGSVDALYLDLHGAMATTSHDDGEGELLLRLRKRLGQQFPIVASLDYHANVSEDMVTLADGLVGYRSYPHIDMAETGARAARLLNERIERGVRHAVAWKRLDFLLPLTSQCTLAQPSAGVIAKLTEIEQTLKLSSCSWTGGFALADIFDCGQAVLAYGDTATQTKNAVEQLADHINTARAAFHQPILDDIDAVTYAVEHSADDSGPIILADTQDNPGGGGASDTTGLLRALIAQRATKTVVATICDPEVVAIAHLAGAGATIHVTVGGKTPTGLDQPGIPCIEDFMVEKCSNGRFLGTGPMWLDAPIDLGPSVLLRCGGVRVIVVTEKMQAADRSLFHHFGIDPHTCRILVLKSSVHFRADFQDIAKEIVVVASPGLVYGRLTQIPYKNLRVGVATD